MKIQIIEKKYCYKTIYYVRYRKYLIWRYYRHEGYKIMEFDNPTEALNYVECYLLDHLEKPHTRIVTSIFARHGLIKSIQQH